jgi:RNA polymerase sigma factor (sigma-70 family)
MSVESSDWLTEQFEASRPRLRAVAYRMLGRHAEAEDAVQDTWLRVGRADAAGIDNLTGWLMTVTSRICLDRLRARRDHPEQPLDAQPNFPGGDDSSDDPEHHAVVAESIGSAMLVVLDLLAPGERVAFVLHDVFGLPFDEIAPILERSPDAARQLASRARRRIQGTPNVPEVDLVRQREVVGAFLHASRRGDFDALLALLDPDAVLHVDATATRSGALHDARGVIKVAAVLLPRSADAARLALVDGVTGVAWMPGGHLRGAALFTVVGDRIVTIDVIGDPDRLDRLDVVLLDT